MVASQMVEASGRRTKGQLIAWLQLLRLPNVFTAIADVMMGFLVARGSLDPHVWFALIAAASASLYLAGMVLNDVCDVAADTKQRPTRPIPSGQISLADARVLGWGLLVTGLICGGIVSFLSGSTRPAWIAGILALAIVLYDGRLKATQLGPLLMGLCRMFNVLLGMSLALEGAGHVLPPNARWIVAVAIGVYTAGITRFARTEAKRSSRWQLVRGLTLVMVGLALIAMLPIWDPGSPHRAPNWTSGWYVYWPILAIVIARRFVLAILDPSPRRVQGAVKSGIVSLIMIDAGICLGVCGPFWGCAVLLLLAPTLLLGLWIDST